MPDTGLIQFLDWGTGSTVNASIGKVTGGDMTPDSNLQHREGIGANDHIVGGPITLGGNATVQLQSESILSYAIRSGFTSPSLTALSFAGGKQAAGRKHTGCYINTLGLTCSVGEALAASIAWLGTGQDVYTTAATAHSSDVTWEWFTATATIAGSAARQVTSWEISLNNNVEPVWTLDTSTAGQMRLPDALHIGSQEITFKCDVLVQPDATDIGDILGDTLATNSTASLVVKGGTSGTDTMTIALSNLSRKSAAIPFVVGGGLVTYSLEFECKKNASCISITVA